MSDTLAFYATYMLHCSAIIWWDWVGQLAKLVTHLYHKLRCGQVLDCFEWWPLCFQFHEEDALLHSLITIPGKHITFNPCTSSIINDSILLWKTKANLPFLFQKIVIFIIDMTRVHDINWQKFHWYTADEIGSLMSMI